MKYSKLLLNACVFILPVLCINSFTANAQFNKGDVLLGGSVGYAAEHTPSSQATYSEEKNSTYFEAAPFAGFFINSKTAIGGSVGYSVQTGYYGLATSLTHFTAKTLSAGVFARHYFKVGEDFYITAQGNVTYGNNKMEALRDGTINVDYGESYQFDVTLSPILIYFPSPKWGIEGGIGSMGFSLSESLSSSGRSKRYYLSLGDIYFGVSYYFRKKA